MDLFDEISKVKEDFPKTKSIKNDVKIDNMNFYQLFAIGFFILFFFLGIVFGNLFSTCDTSSFYSTGSCMVAQFNFSLTLTIWFASLLVSIVFYAIGHIISLLSNINEKLTNFKL